MKKDTIVIIGGTGNFGYFWKRYFEDNGHKVIVTGRTTEIKSEQAVLLGDIIIISVPIRYTIDTIKNIIPFIPEGKLLIDFTGIKTEATEELSKYTKGEVVSTHPMFGPWTKSLENQNIAFDPINPGKKWERLYDIFKNDGAKMLELKSNKHDELVSIVQSSVQMLNLVLGHILKERGINMDELMSISTPNSRMQLCILSRFLNQEASLYTDMQVYNTKYRDEILSDIESYIKNLGKDIKNKELEKIENEFNGIKDYIGKDFIDKAFEVTKKIDFKK